ncbi:MAG: hypothetical protein OXB88_02850 [Bacteriovoracales bacterium]|nr:hypothetical protein [Bacteriovoracales bacterium]
MSSLFHFILLFSLSWGGIASAESWGLYEDILAMTDLNKRPGDNPTEVHSWISSASEEYGGECALTVLRDSWGTTDWADERKAALFNLWFEESSRSSSASASIGKLEVTDPILEMVLTSPESFSLDIHFGRPATEKDPISDIEWLTVHVDGDERVIELRPLDEDAAFAEYNSTYYLNITLIGDEVVRMEKKHWERHLLFGKKVSFHDVCHF